MHSVKFFADCLECPAILLLAFDRQAGTVDRQTYGALSDPRYLPL